MKCRDFKPGQGGVEIKLWLLWIEGHESWHRTVGKPGIKTKTLACDVKMLLFIFHPQQPFWSLPTACVCERESLHSPHHRFSFFLSFFSAHPVVHIKLTKGSSICSAKTSYQHYWKGWITYEEMRREVCISVCKFFLLSCKNSGLIFQDLHG